MKQNNLRFIQGAIAHNDLCQTKLNQAIEVEGQINQKSQALNKELDESSNILVLWQNKLTSAQHVLATQDKQALQNKKNLDDALHYQAFYQRLYDQVINNKNQAQQKLNAATAEQNSLSNTLSSQQSSLFQAQHQLNKAHGAKNAIKPEHYPYTVVVERWVSTREWFKSGKWKAFDEIRYGGPQYDNAINNANNNIKNAQDNFSAKQALVNQTNSKLYQANQNVHAAQKKLNECSANLGGMIKTDLEKANKNLDLAQAAKIVIDNKINQAKQQIQTAQNQVNEAKIIQQKSINNDLAAKQKLHEAQSFVAKCRIDLENSSIALNLVNHIGDYTQTTSAHQNTTDERSDYTKFHTFGESLLIKSETVGEQIQFIEENFSRLDLFASIA